MKVEKGVVTHTFILYSLKWLQANWATNLFPWFLHITNLVFMVMRILWWYRNGDTYDGEYFVDKLHGFGVYCIANGHWYEGAWHEGRRQWFGLTKWRHSIRSLRKLGSWNLRTHFFQNFLLLHFVMPKAFQVLILCCLPHKLIELFYILLN